MWKKPNRVKEKRGIGTEFATNVTNMACLGMVPPEIEWKLNFDLPAGVHLGLRRGPNFLCFTCFIRR